MDLVDGLRLVRTRGMLMKRAGEIAPGGMAAIMGLDIPALEKVCNEASRPDEVVQVANDNCPGQIVISGTRAAIAKAQEIAKARRVKLVRPLPVSIASHCPLMSQAAEEFRESLYRMVAVLTGMGITLLMTAELEDSYVDLRFSPHGTAFLTDAIIMQRYIEWGRADQRGQVGHRLLDVSGGEFRVVETLKQSRQDLLLESVPKD